MEKRQVFGSNPSIATSVLATMAFNRPTAIGSAQKQQLSVHLDFLEKVFATRADRDKRRLATWTPTPRLNKAFTVLLQS
jgi:hypothetical protein